MRTFFFLVFSCLLSVMVHGRKDTVRKEISGTAIVNGASIPRVSGYRYINPIPGNRTFWVERSYALVKLFYKLPSGNSPRPTGTASVTVAIEYLRENNNTFDTIRTSQTLALNFTSAGAQDVSYFKAEGAQNVLVNVSSVSVTGGLAAALELEASVVTESFDFLPSDAVKKSSFSLNHNSSLTADSNLKVYWTAVPEADHYELEWTYISDQKDAQNRYTSSDIPVNSYLFRNNSTRIETDSLFYEIPMIYESGLIIYRLRAVGKNLVSGIAVNVKSDWTAEVGSTLVDYPANNIFVYNGLEQNINWQSSLSFTERGKYKAVLDFNDGTLRSRQKVTRINTDKRVIIGETLYDYNGREVINVLPVPVTENKMSYYPHFNIVDGKKTLSKADYANGNEGKGCDVTAPALDTSTGASKYYSVRNPFGKSGNTGKNLLNRDLLPDAEKYPYIQRFYTSDNTNRVSLKSSPGAALKIGSRPTHYTYGAPQQPELTRLFGAQIGYAPHYKKNIVIDPNGQATVAYLNLEGKVVATGLAGNHPDNLNALPGTQGRTIQTDLLAAGVMNQLTPDGLGKIYTSKFTVTSPNTQYTFNYLGKIGSFPIICQANTSSNPINYSIDGVADIQLILQDNCGQTVFNSNQSSAKGNTGSTQNITINQSPTLQLGEYQITKSLKINEDKLEQYWQEYLAQQGVCIIREDSFRAEELRKVDVKGCGLTCNGCMHIVDSIIAADPSLTDNEKLQLKGACNELCDNNQIACSSGLQAMLGDLSPGGQYAQLRKQNVSDPSIPAVSIDQNGQPDSNIDLDVSASALQTFNGGAPDDNNIDTTLYPLSVFNGGNRLRIPRFLSSLGLNNPYWRNPLQVTGSGYTKENRKNEILFDTLDLTSTTLSYQITDYKDLNGNIVYVNVIKATDGTTVTYTPDITNPSKLELVDEKSQLYRIPVRYLRSLYDVEKYWQTHWANYLVPYHPEYEYYLECTRYNASHSFDFNLISATTLDKAKAAGYVDNNGTPLLVQSTQAASLDPYIKNSTGNYLYLHARDQSYKTLSVNGTSSVRTMAQAVTILLGCPETNQPSCANANCTDGKIDTDEEWTTYRAFYLAEKQWLMRFRAIHRAVDGLYYNGCIGHKDFLSNPDASYFKKPVTIFTPFTGAYYDCFRFYIVPNTYNYTYNCRLITYTAYTASTMIPYENPAQLCSVKRDPEDYEDKVQRFYPSSPSNIGGGQPAQRCSTYVQDDAGNLVLASIPCDNDVQDASDAAVLEAQRFKYSSCGLCPIAADLETFLMQLNSNSLLVPSQNLFVSCDLSQYKVKIGDVLRRALALRNPSSPDVYWSATVSGGGKVLTGKLFNGSTTMATVTLTIPQNVQASFTALSKLCCLTVLSANSFTLEAAYIDQNASVDFKIQGTVDLSLTPCSIPPRCLITDDATRVNTFLNALCIALSSGKGNDLDTKGKDSSLVLPANAEYYEWPVKVLLKKDERDSPQYVDDITTYAPKWNASVSGTTLSGKLSYSENGTSKQLSIQVSNLPAGYSYSQITEFINLQPEKINMSSNDPCITGACNKTTFSADAVIISGQQRLVFPVTVTVPDLKPVVCSPAVAPSN